MKFEEAVTNERLIALIGGISIFNEVKKNAYSMMLFNMLRKEILSFEDYRQKVKYAFGEIQGSDAEDWLGVVLDKRKELGLNE